MNRRRTLKSLVAGAVAACGFGTSTARAQTKHIRLYVEMDIAPAKEQEMLRLFHEQFVSEAVKHDGYIRVKMLKKRAVLMGTAPAQHN
jgi:hypothetical protein